MDSDLTTLARALVALPGFSWTAAWCLAPDRHGRVFRRRWCPDDPGFGFSQVNGPRLRCPRDSSEAIPDLRDPANGGILLAMLGPCQVVRHCESPGWAVKQAGSRKAYHLGATLAEAAARALVAIGMVV